MQPDNSAAVQAPSSDRHRLGGSARLRCVPNRDETVFLQNPLVVEMEYEVIVHPLPIELGLFLRRGDDVVASTALTQSIRDHTVIFEACARLTQMCDNFIFCDVIAGNKGQKVFVRVRWF